VRKESQFPAQLTRLLYYALLVAIWGYIRNGQAIIDFALIIAVILPALPLRYKGKRLDAKWLLVLLATGSALWLIGRTIRCHGKWKTFVDTTAGYQISYPACWFNITYQDYRLPTGHYLLLSIVDFKHSLGLRVYRSLREDSTSQSPQGLIDEIFDIYNYAYGKVEIISGPSYLPQVSPSLDLPGVEVTYRIKNDYYYYRIIAFQYKDSVYAIETVLPAQHKEEGERVLDRIIKSFKFLP